MQNTLFTVTRCLLKIGMGLCAFLAAAMAAAAGWCGLVLLNLDGKHMRMPDPLVTSPLHFGNPATLGSVPLDFAMAVAAPVMLVLMVCFIAILFALLAALRIVESAMAGDPFVEANARRLAHVGWLLLAVQLAGSGLNGLIPWLIRRHGIDPAHGNFHLSMGMTPVGLLAVLMIFVLTQVFRRGSEMRAELQGTV